jgi:hypothetical protein
MIHISACSNYVKQAKPAKSQTMRAGWPLRPCFRAARILGRTMLAFYKKNFLSQRRTSTSPAAIAHRPGDSDRRFFLESPPRTYGTDTVKSMRSTAARHQSTSIPQATCTLAVEVRFCLEKSPFDQ